MHSRATIGRSSIRLRRAPPARLGSGCPGLRSVPRYGGRILEAIVGIGAVALLLVLGFWWARGAGGAPGGVEDQPGRNSRATSRSATRSPTHVRTPANVRARSNSTVRGVPACLATIVAVALVSACGSSGGATTAHRADFVARANAICASGLRKAEGLSTPKSAREVLPFAEHASAIVSGLLAQLNGVTAPASSRAAYAKFLTTVGAEASAIEQLVAALRARDTAVAKTALSHLSSNTSNAEARALGLAECARTRTPSP